MGKIVRVGRNEGLDKGVGGVNRGRQADLDAERRLKKEKRVDPETHGEKGAEG